MKLGQKAVRSPNGYRELSDKELNEITKAMGDQVRAQTIEHKERLIASLRRELDTVRTKHGNNVN